MSAETEVQQQRIGRWGHSLAVRIPAPMARQVRMQEGRPVEITVENDQLVIRAAPETKPRYDLATLLAEITPETLHEEADFGAPVGREAL